jgi:hypothetical protein
MVSSPLYAGWQTHTDVGIVEAIQLPGTHRQDKGTWLAACLPLAASMKQYTAFSAIVSRYHKLIKHQQHVFVSVLMPPCIRQRNNRM